MAPTEWTEAILIYSYESFNEERILKSSKRTQLPIKWMHV